MTVPVSPPRSIQNCVDDQPQQDPPGWLSADDLRIGERAVVGEEGVVVDIVQVHRHAGPHVHGAHAPEPVFMWLPMSLFVALWLPSDLMNPVLMSPDLMSPPSNSSGD